MALIDCPECEKKISDKAASCPNCGFPMAEERGSKRRETFLIDPLAELAELAENSIRALREVLEPERRRGKKKHGEEKAEPTGKSHQ